MTILVSREVPETKDLQKGYNGAFGMDLSLLQQLTELQNPSLFARYVYLRDMLAILFVPKNEQAIDQKS